MYINFQQIQVKTQVMTVHTSLFAKKIASYINLQLPIIIFKNRLFRTLIIVKCTCISIFSKISVKTAHKNSFAKKCKLHKFVTCNSFEKITPFGHAPPPKGLSGRF